MTFFFMQEYHKDSRNNFKQEIAKIQEENKLQIKNKDDELKSLQDKIANFNQTIECLQLKLDKEIAERQRLNGELSNFNNESKVWTSAKSAFERQVSLCFYVSYYVLSKKNYNCFHVTKFIFHFRFLSIKLN